MACWLSALGDARLLAQETADLTDGRQVSGRLELVQGRLRFASPELAAQPAWEKIRRIRFSAEAPGRLPTVPLYRLELWGGQVLSVELRRIDDREVVASAFGETVRASRSALAGVSQLPGAVVVASEDFEHPPAGWKFTAPAPSWSREHSVSGRQSWQLNDTSGPLEFVLPSPLESGRMEVSFFDTGQTQSGRQWMTELEFLAAGKRRVVRVVLGWNESTYHVEAPDGPPLGVQRVARRRGWRRLSVGFGESMSVLVDEAVAAKGGSTGGPLAAVRFATRALPPPGQRGDDRVKGAAYLDDFKLSRRVKRSRLRHEDPSRDKLMLAGGDELFGRLVRADAHKLVWRSGSAESTFSWTEVRGVLCRREPVPIGYVAGPIVRVLWTASEDTEAVDQDLVQGAVADLSAERLVLDHALLGRLTLPRARLRELEYLFYGRRWELDPTYHHLGNNVLDDPVMGLDVPRPEGAELTVRFQWPLAAVAPPRPPAAPAPANAATSERYFVALHVVQLEGAGPGSPRAAEIARGELRTYLAVNGRQIDDLNRHVTQSSLVPRRVRIALPPGTIQPGPNSIVLRQVPLRSNPEEFDDCGVFGIALEAE